LWWGSAIVEERGECGGVKERERRERAAHWFSPL